MHLVTVSHFFFFLFFFFLMFWDAGVPLFHQFIVNNYNFSKHCYYYILLQRITCYNHLSRSFCLLSVFLVLCLIDRGFCWRRLTLSVLFRLTASSRPGFPYCPFSSNALSSGAIGDPSPACVVVPPFGIFSSKLLTFRKIR
jgi:hypothetical protein